MIYDRTIEDVREAKRLRQNVIQQNGVLTDNEKAILERGMVTPNTINRIAEKQREICDIINGLGYFDTPIDIIQCMGSEIFSSKDFNILVKNNAILRKAFFVFKSSPKNAVARYHFEEFNALEKILHDLQEMADIMKSYIREAGTFEAGD